MKLNLLLTAALVLGAMAAHAADDAPLRILYVTKSEGFEHGPVAEVDGQPSLSQKILEQLASKNGWEVTTTKDASQVNADDLANYDVVAFYTQGDLRNLGTKDEGEPMTEQGLQDLLAWVQQGGGFVAIHSGTDSFRSDSTDEKPADYIAMVGGEFRGHGPQFVGKLKVVDPNHPIAAGQPEVWKVNEEWYLFRHFNAENIHVIATLDPGRARRAIEAYDLPDLPMVWIAGYGDGRVYVNGMGHRDDVWESDNFQNWLVNGIEWASGKGEAMATPNYAEQISADLDPRTGTLTDEAKARREADDDDDDDKN